MKGLSIDANFGEDHHLEDDHIYDSNNIDLEEDEFGKHFPGDIYR